MSAARSQGSQFQHLAGPHPLVGMRLHSKQFVTVSSSISGPAAAPRFIWVRVTKWGLTADVLCHAAPVRGGQPLVTYHEAMWLDNDEGVVTSEDVERVRAPGPLDFLLLNAIPSNTNDHVKDWRAQASQFLNAQSHEPANDVSGDEALKRLLTCSALLDRVETRAVQDPGDAYLPQLRADVCALVDSLLGPVAVCRDIVGLLMLRSATYRRCGVIERSRYIRDMWGRLETAFPGIGSTTCHLRGADMLLIAAVPAKLCMTQQQELESESGELPEYQEYSGSSGYESFIDTLKSAGCPRNDVAATHLESPLQVLCLCMAVHLNSLFSASTGEQAAALIELGRCLQPRQRFAFHGHEYSRQFCAQHAVRRLIDGNCGMCQLLFDAVALYLTTVGPSAKAPLAPLGNAAATIGQLRFITPDLAAHFVMQVLMTGTDPGSFLFGSAWSPATHVLNGSSGSIVHEVQHAHARLCFEASVAASTVLGPRLSAHVFERILAPFASLQIRTKYWLQYALVASSFDCQMALRVLRALGKSTEECSEEVNRALLLFDTANGVSGTPDCANVAGAVRGAVDDRGADRDSRPAIPRVLLEITAPIGDGPPTQCELLQRCLAVAAMARVHAGGPTSARLDHGLVAQSMVIPAGWDFVRRFIHLVGERREGGEGMVSRVEIPEWMLASLPIVHGIAVKVLPHARVSMKLDGIPSSEHILPRHLIMPWEAQRGEQMAAVVMPLAVPFSDFLTSVASALLAEYCPEEDGYFSAMKVGLYAITMYAVEGVQRGLQALHVCGQSHGDVKPDNVVMQWDRARFSTRDVLVASGQTWIGADLSLLSLRAAAAHLHSNAECAPRVSLIDVSDDVVTPKYAPAVSLGGRADDDYAWGLTLIEALVEAEHIGRRFCRSVHDEADAVTALSLPECQQLAPLFRHGGVSRSRSSDASATTAEALVADASLLRLRDTPSCSVLRADLDLFAACSDAGFDIIDTDSDDASDGFAFRAEVRARGHIDLKQTVALVNEEPLSGRRVKELDALEVPWRAALVVLDRAHRNAAVGTEAATQLQRLRTRVLNVTRRAIAAKGGVVPWEAIARWVGAANGTEVRTHQYRTVTLLRALSHNECWKISFSIAAARSCARSFRHSHQEESQLRRVFFDILDSWFRYCTPMNLDGAVVPDTHTFARLLTDAYGLCHTTPGRVIAVAELRTKAAAVNAAVALDADTKGLVVGERQAGAPLGHCCSVVSGDDDGYTYFDDSDSGSGIGARASQTLTRRCRPWCGENGFETHSEAHPLAVAYSISATEEPSP